MTRYNNRYMNPRYASGYVPPKGPFYRKEPAVQEQAHHTPGPWQVAKGAEAVLSGSSKYPDMDASVLGHLILAEDSIVVISVDREPDARLIAAAPDGLDFAREFVDWAENCAAMFSWHDVEGLDADEGWLALKAQASAFIAKATGASS